MGKPKVLIVDDDPQVRRVVVRLLEPWCETESFPGGPEALEALRLGRRPDLVVSDVDMPTVDGPALYRFSVEERLLPKEAFIFMSGRHIGEKISYLLKERLLVIRKPFEHDYFLMVVETRLSEMALTRFRRVTKMMT